MADPPPRRRSTRQPKTARSYLFNLGMEGAFSAAASNFATPSELAARARKKKKATPLPTLTPAEPEEDEDKTAVKTATPTKSEDAPADEAVVAAASTSTGEEEGDEGSLSDEPDVYEVEKVLKDKIEDGQKMYFLKWKGYSHKHNSWEPEVNLNCKALIRNYETAKERKKPPQRRGRPAKRRRISKKAHVEVKEAVSDEEFTMPEPVAAPEVEQNPEQEEQKKAMFLQRRKEGLARLINDLDDTTIRAILLEALDDENLDSLANVMTRETKWARFGEGEQPPQVGLEGTDTNDPTNTPLLLFLSMAWVQIVGSDSVYYWNRTENTTSWEAPTVTALYGFEGPEMPGEEEE